MNISEEHIEKITLTLNSSPTIIKNVYRTLTVKNPVQNDYYNNSIGNILDNIDTNVEQDGNIIFKNKEDCKFLYCNKFCETDFALDFSDVETLEGERFFLVSNIRCIENKKMIMWLGGRNSRIKVWVNDRIVFNGISIFINCELFLLELSKGDNLVFIEMSRIVHDLSLLKLTVKVAEYEGYSETLEYKVIQSYINRDVLHKVQVIQESNEINGTSYSFIILPRDFVNVSQSKKVTVTLKDSSGKVYENIETMIGEKTEFAVDKIIQCLQGNNFITMEIEYEKKSGGKGTFANTLIVGGIDNQIKIIKNQYAAICRNNEISSDCKNTVERKIKIAEETITEINNHYKYPVVLIQLLKDTINEIFKIISQGDGHNRHIKMGSNMEQVYYLSELDGQEERYTVILPGNYSCDKKYPLVIFLPGNRYDDDVMLSQSEMNYGDVILVQISCKGMTFGSYIGEATFLETFKKIINSYKIDYKRVYLMGFCSGAYAAWALAQAYPFLFAAMVVSGGGAYAKNLHNLDNIKILNICSHEVENLERFHSIPTKILSNPSSNYVAMIFKETGQYTLNYILCRSSYAVEWLLEQKKETYPKKIFYRTDHIRHNKTYWIEIVCIEKGKRYCKVEGELVDSNYIKINMTNIDAFILEIPDAIDKRNINIQINENQVLAFKDVAEEKLYFKKLENTYLAVAKADIGTGTGSSFGLGILDIYMDSLKIVIPSFFNSKMEEDIIRSIAGSFSNPITTGINPKIYIDYPLVTNKQISDIDTESCNLLLIGDVYYDLLAGIKDTLLLEFDHSGFRYKGNYKKGDYCIIMIYPNPMNVNKKVLYLYANNYKLLKNVFTRKVIIPTYFNGVHPQLNNEVILFDGVEYFLIYSVGDEIQRA